MPIEESSFLNKAEQSKFVESKFDCTIDTSGDSLLPKSSTSSLANEEDEPESTEIPNSPARQVRKRKKSKSSSSFETNCEPIRPVRKRVRNDSTTSSRITQSSNRSLTQHEFHGVSKQNTK